MAKARNLLRIFVICLSFIFSYLIFLAGMASASRMLISAMEYKERVGFMCIWLILNMTFYLFIWLAFRILTETSRYILLTITVLFLAVNGLLLMMASMQLRDEIGYGFGFILWLLAIFVPMAESAASQKEATLFP